MVKLVGHLLRGLLVAAPLLGGIACAAHSHRRWGTALGEDRLGAAPMAQARARPLRVAIHRLRPDPGEESLPASAITAEIVRRLTVPDDLEFQVLPAWLHERPLHEILPLAAQDGYDALVCLDMLDGRLRFDSFHWVALPNLLLWAGAGYPSHWAHDCRYVGQVQLDLRVYDVQRARLLRAWRPAPARHEDMLNYHERTRGIWPYVVANICPPMLYPTDDQALLRAFISPLLQGPVAELGRVLQELPYGHYRLELQSELSGDHRLTHPGLEEGRPLTTPMLSAFQLEFQVAQGNAKPSRVLVDGRPVWQEPIPAPPDDQDLGRVRIGPLNLAGQGALVELEDSQGVRSRLRLRARPYEAQALGPAPE